MSKLDTLLLEALFFNKDKTPPSKEKKSTGITLKQYIKFKKEFDELQKLMKEEEKKEKPKDDKKDGLTFWQKVVLLHIGALTYFATLALLFRLTFH